MTATKEVTIWCDTCGGWLMLGTPSEGDARSLLEEKGWVCSDSQDTCPRCQTEADPDFQDTFTRDDLRDRPLVVSEAAAKKLVTILDEDGNRRFTISTMSAIEKPSLHHRWPVSSPYQ